MNPDAIPLALRKVPQWVVWSRETRNGKVTKVPRMANKPGVRASVTDPSTWAPFADAMRAVDQRRHLAGVGFVLTPNDPFVGVDIDDCIIAGAIAPEALEIVRFLDSYTEISPSGLGLRGFIRATFHRPGTGKRGGTAALPWCKKIEIYGAGRYLTVTGNLVHGSPSVIHERQAQLDELARRLWPPTQRGSSTTLGVMGDEELLGKARASRNGAAFARLYDHGNVGDHGDDHSRADLALCSILAFWCGDEPERIDRLFRRSKLYREKWEREDYRAATIRKAIDSCSGRFYGSAGRGPSTDQRPRVPYRREDSGATTKRAEAILAERSPPELFERASCLCEVVPQRFITERRPDGSEQSKVLDAHCAAPATASIANRFVIRPIRPAPFQNLLSEAMVFTKCDRNGRWHPSGVPGDVARALFDQGHWSLPVLEGISDIPLLRDDGSIHAVHGYDPATGFYYTGQGTFAVPERPGLAEARAAANYLLSELLVDFPFVEPCHRSAALALLLSLAARSNFRPGADDQCLPSYLCSAPIRGSGKTYLFKAIYAGLFGQLPFISIVPHNKEEWGKTLLTLALEGAAAVLWDNVESGSAFGSSHLDAVLTSGCVEGRILGVSRFGKAMTNAIHMVTGNNLRVRGDMPRRTIPIRQDAKRARPELRTGYKHPDLIGWARENQRHIVTAAFTILRAHALAGFRGHDLGVLGGFTKWDRVVRSPVLWLGLADPCGGMQELHDHGDDDTADRRELLEAIRDALPDRSFDSKQAYAIALSGKDQLPIGLGGPCPELPPAARLYNALLPESGRRLSPGGVGKRLAGIQDSPAGGLVLRRELDPSNKALWLVQEWQDEDDTHPAETGGGS